MKLTISNVPSIKDYVSKKTNKPYKKIYFKANEYGSDVVSGFYRAEMSNWKKGNTIEVLAVSDGTVSADGKSTFRDFKMPKRENPAKEITKLKDDIEYIVKMIVKFNIDLEILKEHIVQKKKPHAQVDYPVNDLDEAFPDEDTREVPAEEYDEA